MSYGKRTCKILKEIRRQIAERNDIAYVTSECHFEGECKGTCPKCEAELRYLENELQKRKLMGKAAAIAGISLGIAGTFSACNAPQQKINSPVSEQEIVTEMPPIEIIPDAPNKNTGDFYILSGEVDGDVEPNTFEHPDIIPIADPVEIADEEE